jgi:hypothetical protein
MRKTINSDRDEMLPHRGMSWSEVERRKRVETIASQAAQVEGRRR